MFSTLRLICLFALALLSARSSSAVVADAGHRPIRADVPFANGNTNPRRQFREPFSEISNNPASPTAVTIYSVIKKLGNSFGTANQTGGTLFYKGATQGSWQQQALGFHADDGSFQYWKASFSTSSFGANEVIQYYLYLTIDSGAENTFIFAGPGFGDAQSQVAAGNANDPNDAAQLQAKSNPFTIRNRPAFLFHANNRVIQGQSVQFWVKAGYIGKDDSLDSRWANQARIYYSTDPLGPAPTGSLGVAGPGTQVATMNFDHRENDNSIAGNAMWWEGTVGNLPSFTNIRYKIGVWHSSNNEEKFADYVAAADNQTFSFSIGTIGDPELTVSGLNANYTTSKLFVNEVAGDSVPLDIVFVPKQPNVDPASVQVYTNLNRRDRAQADANGDGVEDGILPPNGDLVGDNDDHYYRAHTMQPGGTDGQGNARFTLTLPASKTGAYRLTARYRFNSSATWNYYTSGGRRDHAITVSPKKAREMVMYELNTSNAEATGPTFEERSTFDDLLGTSDGDTDGFDPFNLAYLQNLGVNWLWFQPIHPQGIDGRQIDPETNAPYEVGSPYAVKNFFTVAPLMGSENNLEDALLEFQNFVNKTDAGGINVMLDAPFNHSAYDMEVAAPGVPYFGGTASAEMRDTELRFFSRANDYCQRADLGNPAIAVAPDRGDFGKFADTYDIFWGRYSALVCQNPQDNGNYNNEGDFFDFSLATGNFDAVTQNVWRYFADYTLFWLEQTGCPAGTSLGDQLYKGIDGLRADFGQGLPPQAWEYIVNKTRTRKWSFVFMAESLDGGAVTYRSNRHFDVLNENITFAFAGATTTDAYRSIYDGRRSAYGQGLVLLNSTSHDEANYADPYEALIRFAVNGSVDGVPMIFYGQELGISGGTFGFSRYESNFGKQIPQFKKFNSLKPAWDDATFANDQLYPVYSGVAQARLFSPALRSSNRFFLNQLGDGSVQPKLFSVAKFATRNASPASSDVVFAFANLDRNTDQQGNFNISQDVDGIGGNDYGIKPDRTYDFKNIAAYLGPPLPGFDQNRRDHFLNRKTGAQLLNGGLFVLLNKVPTMNSSGNPADPAWNQRPFEGQYLKLYDVTTPSTTAGQPAPANAYGYAIGTSTLLSWTAAPADSEGQVPTYKIVGSDGSTYFTSSTSVNVIGGVGTVTYTVFTVNPNDSAVVGPGSASTAISFLTSGGDEDGDGETNAEEDTAATNPFDAGSVFRVTNITRPDANTVSVTWSTVVGKMYQLEGSTAPAGSYGPVGSQITAGSTTFTQNVSTSTPQFYRVRVLP